MRRRTQVKICGINTPESAIASSEAEFIGFVFYQKSPRFVSAFQAKEISTFLKKNQKRVGLFVNSELNLIKHIAEFVKLDVIQLHGNETIDDIKLIKNELKKPIIKAIPVRTIDDIKSSRKFQDVCDMLLFDAITKKNVYWGTGSTFDWNLLKNFKSKKHWLLAGGININNVKRAIFITKTPIIDISSGVEKDKGIKCKNKIKQFINYLNENEI